MDTHSQDDDDSSPGPANNNSVSLNDSELLQSEILCDTASMEDQEEKESGSDMPASPTEPMTAESDSGQCRKQVKEKRNADGIPTTSNEDNSTTEMNRRQVKTLQSSSGGGKGRAAVQQKKSKQAAAVREEDNALRMISNAIRDQSKIPKVPNEDEYDAYGRYIAHELRSIKDLYTRDLVKQEFSKVLFNAKWSSTNGVNSGNLRPAYTSETTMGTGATFAAGSNQAFSNYQGKGMHGMPGDWNYANNALPNDRRMYSGFIASTPLSSASDYQIGQAQVSFSADHSQMQMQTYAAGSFSDMLNESM